MRYLISTLLVIVTFQLSGRAQTKAIQYTRDFVFRPGLYLTFSDFKNNKPIPPSRIQFKSHQGDKDFMRMVVDQSTIVFLDSTGKEWEVKSREIWGYSSNGSVFVSHGTDFNRINVIGSLSHFVATIPVRVGMNDPFYYNDPFQSGQQYTYVSSQYVMDFETGKILEFNSENMEALLKRDEALFKEFTALKKKQKRDMIFVYLRKFNEKYPIYFPE